MKKVLLFISGLVISLAAIAQPSPVGWASLNGGTTGGFGGEVVNITSRAEFVANVTGDEARVLLIHDTIELELYERIKVYSNKTIFGFTQNAMLRFGGLEIVGDNVIVQNLVIGDFYDGDWSGTTHSTDCLTLYGENIWIDHCWLWAGADGLLDIRSGNGSIADYITISYTRFSDHNKVTLVGSSDQSTQDRDHLRTTFHHCWYDATFDKGLNQRMPRVRFGDVHVFNNYYEEISSYCVAARFESDVVVESTYFRNTSSPHEINDVGEGLEDPDLVAINNIYELCSGSESTNGEAWTPSDFYEYTPDPTWDIPAIVMNEAGPYNPGGNQPPVAVNDTVDYSGMSGGVTVLPAENDEDADGGDLRVAQLASNPPGIAFIKENKIIYAPPSNASGIDTIMYTLVDTQGGIDTGMVLIFYDGLSSSSSTKAEKQIDLFPNPASDWVSLQLPKALEPGASITLYNSSGDSVLCHSCVAQTAVKEYRLSTTHLSPGIYWISINYGEGVVTKKLVIAK